MAVERSKSDVFLAPQARAQLGPIDDAPAKTVLWSESEAPGKTNDDQNRRDERLENQRP